MRNPVEHCDKQIARLRSEIERREVRGQNTDEHHRRLKTLQALRAVHAGERSRSTAA